MLPLFQTAVSRRVLSFSNLSHPRGFDYASFKVARYLQIAATVIRLARSAVNLADAVLNNVGRRFCVSVPQNIHREFYPTGTALLARHTPPPGDKSPTFFEYAFRCETKEQVSRYF